MYHEKYLNGYGKKSSKEISENLTEKYLDIGVIQFSYRDIESIIVQESEIKYYRMLVKKSKKDGCKYLRDVDTRKPQKIPYGIKSLNRIQAKYNKKDTGVGEKYCCIFLRCLFERKNQDIAIKMFETEIELIKNKFNI